VKAATASSSGATIPMLARSRPSRTRWTRRASPLVDHRERQQGDEREDVGVGLEPQTRCDEAAHKRRSDLHGARLRGSERELDSDRMLAGSEREAERVNGTAREPLGDLLGGEIFANLARHQRRSDLGARAEEQARECAEVVGDLGYRPKRKSMPTRERASCGRAISLRAPAGSIRRLPVCVLPIIACPGSPSDLFLGASSAHPLIRPSSELLGQRAASFKGGSGSSGC
jgi:hypothetical protein